MDLQPEDHTSSKSFDNTVPLAPELTSEQQLRIANNRHAALQNRRARRLQVIQSIPVHHIHSDSQKDTDVVWPLLLTTHQTSSHRNKLAFGRISATQARHHCAVRASDSSAKPQASLGASASLPFNHVQRDCQDDSHQCAKRAIECSSDASAISVSVPTDPDPLLQEPV